MHRTSRTLAVLSIAALALTACGGDDADTVADTTTTEAGADAAFPVTIEHEHGSTTIESAPTRVVTVGLVEQDALLALGVVPVATTEWFGGHDGSIWPWAQDELEALGSEAPESLGDASAINFEAIAAQEPDLILAVYAAPTEADYEKLSQIAPTIAPPSDVAEYGVGWDQLTLTVGQAIGKAEEAEALVDEVEGLFEAARAAHPDFDGARGVVATPYDGVTVYGPDDARGQLLTKLGFVLPEGLADLVGDQFSAAVPAEQLALLEGDLLLWILDDVEANLQQLHDEPLIAGLDVVESGGEVPVGSNELLGAATSFVTVLSLPDLLEGIVPMMALAVDGDPATQVPVG